MSSSRIEKVFQYHEKSKHGFRSFAPGPHHMDWSIKPNPYRKYLPKEQTIQLLREECNINNIDYHNVLLNDQPTSSKPVDISTISSLFWNSCAISAWKSIPSSKWSLRVNPSSGNLHPTEFYWISNKCKHISETPYISHYRVQNHALEIRRKLLEESWNEGIGKREDNLVGYVGITSIHWREAWKYGIRAYRYCQHDIGHAIACVTLAASALGWKTQLLPNLSHYQTSQLLGLNEKSDETADCILAIYKKEVDKCIVFDEKDVEVTLKGSSSWYGVPNLLSNTVVPYSDIDEISFVCQKEEVEEEKVKGPLFIQQHPKSIYENKEIDPTKSFTGIVRHRRSAVDFDPNKSMISVKSFYQILENTVTSFVTERWPYPPQVHFVLFVHRVEGISPGIYFLIRNVEHEEEIKSILTNNDTFSEELEEVKDCPKTLKLYRLHTGDVTQVAMGLSCTQDIASDGSFSLGMIARFEDPIRMYGSWFYPKLFWECGMLGQLLYLEAEYIGIRGTGIGCFFDNPVHHLLGFTKNTKYQSLYHFTIGYPVHDKRLKTTMPEDDDDEEE